jgi:PAS domain S-box-containing protein
MLSENFLSETAGGSGEGQSEIAKLSRRINEQNRYFEAILSSISDFAYTFDKEGRFLFINQALLDLWGLQLEEAVGKNFFELNYPDEPATRLQRQIRQVFDTRQRVTARHERLRPRRPLTRSFAAVPADLDLRLGPARRLSALDRSRFYLPSRQTRRIR